MTRAPRSRPGAGEPTADVLAAEWALGVLEPAEREAAEARAAADPDFAAAAAAWSERLSALAEEAPAVEPTADLWPRIAAALGDPTVAPAAPPANVPPAAGAEVVELAPRRHMVRWRRLAGVATGLAAASVVLAVFAVSRHPLAPPPLLSAKLEPPGAAVISGGALYTAVVDRGRGSVVLTPIGPGPVDARARELWLIPKGGAPIAAGMIRRDAPRPVKLAPELVKAADAGASLAVSLEPDGGAPDGKPTGPIIASGVLKGA